MKVVFVVCVFYLFEDDCIDEDDCVVNGVILVGGKELELNGVLFCKWCNVFFF